LSSDKSKGLWVFAGVLVLLMLLRISFAYAAVPLGVRDALNVLVTIVFVALPVFGLFMASKHDWTPKLGAWAVVAGLALHLGGALLARFVLREQGLGAVLLMTVGQTGLAVWCVGLGALLAALIKDKNLLLPVGAFLAGFDMLVVFMPSGPVNWGTRVRPEVIETVAYRVPTVGSVEPLAFIGPADFFFLAMFFVALHKFGMRSRQTLAWIVPVLIAYLLVVVLGRGVSLGPVPLSALPALLPIGLTVLAVNWGEFKLSKSEARQTLGVVVFAVALAALGLYMAISRPRQAGPPAPSQTVDAQAPPESEAMPGREPSGPPR
jgi:hypothetical protein